MAENDQSEVDQLHIELEGKRVELDEALRKLAEMEMTLEEVKKSIRLQVLEAKEEVRERTEKLLDEMRAQKESMRSEYMEALTKKDEEIAQLQRRLADGISRSSPAAESGTVATPVRDGTEGDSIPETDSGQPAASCRDRGRSYQRTECCKCNDGLEFAEATKIHRRESER